MKTNQRNKLPRRADAVIIGAGQAGLATSAELTRRGVDHVIVERGETANSWRTERWDSLRLLTPNWQTQLPDRDYQGDDPDGFMRVAELIDFFCDYAHRCDAPVRTNTTVTRVSQCDVGFLVETDQYRWQCRSVVLASGPYNRPSVPALAAAVPTAIQQLTPHDYNNAEALDPGGVLVVGAAATGMQITRELQQSGRQVTLAVGEHIRMPRSYRGLDIERWMQVTGLLDEGYCEVDDLQRVRSLPSPQLIGHPDHIDLDINTLRDLGVNIVGRVAGLQDDTLQFSGSLANVAKMADLKQGRLLASVDEWIKTHGVDGQFAAQAHPEPTRLDATPRLDLRLASGEIKTILWATGFRPDYSWLDVPVLDRKGLIQHRGGVTPIAGLYAMGLPFMRKRKSASIYGAAEDARFIASHLTRYLAKAKVVRADSDGLAMNPLPREQRDAQRLSSQ